MTSQTINLELIPQGVAPVIHVSQYDKGQTWLFNLYSGGSPFSVPSGSSVTIQGTKKDGTGFQYACSYSGSVVTAIEQEQMTVLSGKVPCEIVIINGTAKIASINIVIEVEPAALSDDTVISETDLPLFIHALEAAGDAEAYAVGTRNGVPVASGDPAYHNNALYYAENFVGYVTDSQYASLQTIFSIS